MKECLEKIHVENFKSLRNFDIELGKFNVLIGPNGSGKTNVLELFKFINLCISPDRNPPYPFTPWWGFNNIVWSGKEELSILFSLQYSMYDTVANYSAEISGAGGKFSFLSEKYNVENLVKITRNSNTVEYLFDRNFLDTNKDEIRSISSTRHQNIEALFSSTSHIIPDNRSILKYTYGWSAAYSSNHKLCVGDLHIIDDGVQTSIPFVSPAIRQGNNFDSLLPSIQNFLTSHNKILFLRQLNLNKIRQPSSIGNSTILREDGDGLINILFSWYTKNAGKLPDRITAALEELFPRWQISFTITDDGRIMLNVNDGDLTLYPTSIPDGFYKLLTILTAIELNPRILLIDEVDTSLHAEIIEYLISSFKTSNSTIIITTHSPLVIDLVDLEDLVLLERIGTETRPHRIQDPNVMRQKLQEKGITPSESWLYAEL